MAIPQIKTLAQLQGFDYTKFGDFYGANKGDSLDGLRSIFGYFMHPSMPLLAALAYLLLSKPMCVALRTLCGHSAEDTVAEVNKREKQGEVHPKKAKIMAWDSGIKMFTALHSAALTAYSWWTFVNAYAAVMASTEIYLLANPGMSFTTALVHNCIDKKSNLWMNNDFATITIHFYLSKFWEFADTWITQCKGYEPILLQTYHHAGVVICMYSFVITRNVPCAVTLCCFNSFIHTIMYSYYTLQALNIGKKFLQQNKWIITICQLLQFFSGISCTAIYYFIEDSMTEAQFWSTVLIHAYTIVLIYLFGDFAYNEYIVKRKAKKNA